MELLNIYWIPTVATLPHVFSQVMFLIFITFFLTSYGVTDPVETRKIVNLFILEFVQFFLFHNNAYYLVFWKRLKNISDQTERVNFTNKSVEII
jgi:hypothetical protein